MRRHDVNGPYSDAWLGSARASDVPAARGRRAGLRSGLRGILVLTLALAAGGCARLGIGEPPVTPSPLPPRVLTAERVPLPTSEVALPAPPADPDPALLATIAALIGGDPTADAPVILTLAAGLRPGATPTPAPVQDPTQAAASIATLIAMATAQAASATPPPVIGTGSLAAGTAEPGCQIPREPFRFELAPAAEADPAAARLWSEHAAWAFEADLIDLVEEQPGSAGRASWRLSGSYAMPLDADAPDLPPSGQPLPPGLPNALPTGLPLLLRYRGPALPLSPGNRYLLAYDSDQPRDGPLGEGLLVSDARGLVLLGVSLRESEDADARLLAGLRAGFAIRQMPTVCRHVEADGCGFELRAAPVELADALATPGPADAAGDAVDGPGGASLRLNAGETGTLTLERPYTVRLATSHYRLWRGDQPCAAAGDWRLSYRIERAE